MEACTQQIDVYCALIIKDDRILITQRSEKMKLPLKWEFPGGKLENNEKAETAIIREIKEELLMNIEVLKPLKPTEHD
ncbi:MAG TPA: NUDIX domain-containing protein [Chitinophagales bacterium]|jgi:8-oxo-dGTP diphosphatase|nr:NUDIX domain-containing protein [Chitinophagales bacterium]HQV78127.1 NUDIX domain-containing protein [Chitinophagales bacterium]HQW79324.1 NUDIX domain-containing protein [Chitinophagales bacterium]HRB67232.1 NUDIX domain-containing protein [Chitinophagales bacterium]